MGRNIRIDEIEIGEVLSEPILNRYGQVVAGSGTIIDEKQLTRLRTWGITHITVKSDQEDEINPQLLALARERIDKRLSWAPRNAIEEDMYNAAVARAVKLITAGRGS
jgi:hypothetical protein